MNSLLEAVQQHDLKQLKLLLRAKPSADERSEALYYALKEYFHKAIQPLLKQPLPQADIQAAFAYAVKRSNDIELIIPYVKKEKNHLPPNDLYDLLVDTIKTGDLELIQLALDLGADPNNQEALELALSYWSSSRPHILKFLISKGADPSFNKEYLLRQAVANGDLNMTKFLVDTGLNLHVENETPLLTACVKKYPTIVEYLLAKGADPNALGSKLIYTMLQSPMESSKEIKMLLDAGYVIDDYPEMIELAVNRFKPRSLKLLLDSYGEDMLLTEDTVDITDFLHKLATRLEIEEGQKDFCVLLAQHGYNFMPFLLWFKQSVYYSHSKYSFFTSLFTPEQVAEGVKQRVMKRLPDLKQVHEIAGKGINPQTNTDLELLKRLKGYLNG